MTRFLLCVFLLASAATAQQSPHGPIKLACETCHSTDSWALRTDAAFNHNSTGFALEGRHQSVACKSCHEGLVFTSKNPDCASCHTDIHKNELGSNCVRCHSSDGWVVADMRAKHEGTRFPLLGRHGLINCDDCHTRETSNRFAGTPVACIACHKKEYEATTAPNHVAAGFGVECMTCHRVNDLSWPGGFDHNLTSFPLTGIHQTTPCADCHKNNTFDKLSVNCYDCHKADFENSQSPNHVAGGFSQQCAVCHTTAAWRPASFDHSATRFPLTGKHARLECQTCHTNGNYQLTFTDCYQCHSADFNGVSSPNHVAGNFSHNCLTCHTTSAWSPATFSHAATNFPLTGAHASAECQSCHANGNYQLTYTDCYQCHQGDFSQTTNPNHATGNFSHACLTCHTTAAWQPATFDHAPTQFPLTGAHTTIQCASCHVNGNYQLAYTNCYQCHKPDFDATTNPNHASQNFSQNCLTCHTTAAWQPASFDHNLTHFALTGAHTTIQCASCHINNNYQLTYTDCYQCHKPDFDATTNPNHVTQNFSQNCLTCHTTAAWQPASFDHSLTHFALTGAHTALQCASCHVNNNYQLVYSSCYQCHQADFNQTTDPNHVTQNFSHDCLTCHTTTSWDPPTFNHSQTQLPLTGAHTTIECVSCHTSGNYQLVYASCYQCHQPAFEATTNPNHVTQSISHDCVTCHTTAVWQPATFDHNQTQLPLTGAHTTIQCVSCHVSGNYQLTYANCYQCHKPDYDATTNPNHITQNIGQNCVTCHTTAGWQPAAYDHNQTQFPLTGAHTSVVCASCHVNGNYQLAYANCYQCHKPDYDATTNPNHVTQNIGQNCVTCHSTTAWQPASFDHAATAFPLTGAHTTIVCASCHVNGNYQLTYTDCYQCHKPDFDAAAAPNHVTQSFSHNCLTCHTTSVWQPSTFDHAATQFPLTGAHTTIQCSSCHVNGNYQIAYTNCYQCHKPDYDATTNPNHVTQNISQNCVTCHTTTAWQPASFDHSQTQFPLTGAHTAIICSSCHISGNYQLAYTSCYQCHQPDFVATTNPNHVTQNFSQNCLTCHTTTAWSPAIFDHSTTRFSLTGAHTTILCASCHVNNNYQLAYTDCYQCHKTQFEQPTDPNHVLPNFDHDCTPCHTTTAWIPTTFKHDELYFKIYSGRHRGYWSTCATCHGDPANYASFTCFNCHTHDQAVTDGHHVGIAGYAYTSAACYSCHRGV